MLWIYREEFAKELAPLIELSEERVLDILETPPSHIEGDIAFPCFQLAKTLKKAPSQIASDVIAMLAKGESAMFFSHFVAVGPYVNAVIAGEHLAQNVINTVVEKWESFGAYVQANPLKMLIESPSPNTNKPLHLGHVRNMLLGNILASVNSFVGHDVVKVEIVNDRGIHICKSMLAYKLWWQERQPDKKSDHFVGDWYVRFSQENKNDPTLMDQAQKMLQNWEAGDIETRALWSTMNWWAEQGMKETYKRYGTKIDHAHYESDIYNYGKDIVLEWLDKKIFERDEKWNVVYVIDREEDKKIVVLRSDDTALYATQDIALVKLRYDEYKMDAMIHVVGSEQKYYFKQLFAVFAALGYPFVNNCHHMAYGMIQLPDGKMKSREWNVVDADTLADDVHSTALVQILERYPDIAMDVAHERAEAIAMGAIKFAILKHDMTKGFVFHKDESLSFDWETGPYVQYTHARAAALLRRAKDELIMFDELSGFDVLAQWTAKDLALVIAKFPQIVQKIAIEHVPSLLPRYLIELSHAFNRFYQQQKIFEWDIKEQQQRLALVRASRQVLQNWLNLLGIVAPEVM